MMRVFKLLQDLPDVQAGELFLAREVDGVEKYFSTLADDLRYDLETIIANPVWFQEVQAVHAEFEQIKKDAQALLAKLEGLQSATPDHVDLTPATDRVSNVITHLTNVEPLVDHPSEPLTTDQAAPEEAPAPVLEAVPVTGAEVVEDPQPEVVQQVDVPVAQTEPAVATNTGAEGSELTNPSLTPAEVDPALDAQNDVVNPDAAPQPDPEVTISPEPVDIPVATPTDIPTSVQETVEAPAEPQTPPPVVTNIEPNPFTS